MSTFGRNHVELLSTASEAGAVLYERAENENRSDLAERASYLIGKVRYSCERKLWNLARAYRDELVREAARGA